MKHVTYFKTMMEDLQAVNLTEKGISFAEEGFTQLYEQSMAAIDLQQSYIEGILDGFSDGFVDGAMDTFKDVYNKGVKRAEARGIVIGVVSTGVTVGLMKIRKNRIDKKQKLDETKGD